MKRGGDFLATRFSQLGADYFCMPAKDKLTAA
jgi:hypothetical protein